MSGNHQAEYFADLVDFMGRISDHVYRDRDKAKKGFGDTMRGQVLELKSEQLKREGRQEGRQEGRNSMLIELVKDGIITIAEAAKRAGISESSFKLLL